SEYHQTQFPRVPGSAFPSRCLEPPSTSVVARRPHPLPYWRTHPMAMRHITLMLVSGSLLLAQAPVKVGFVYVSPIGDAGYTYQHDLGRKQMEAALKGKVVTQIVENVE